MCMSAGMWDSATKNMGWSKVMQPVRMLGHYTRLIIQGYLYRQIQLKYPISREKLDFSGCFRVGMAQIGHNIGDSTSITA